MRTQTQYETGSGILEGLRAGRRPLWLRTLGILCLVLVVVMSTIQVCHLHGEMTGKQGSRQGDPTSENHCPLCVAMQSALPAGIHVSPEPLATVKALDSVAADAERMLRWRFEMASQPPPVTSDVA